MAGLPASERIILAVDTSDPAEADRLSRMASDAGARFVKYGLELSTAPEQNWATLSRIAEFHGLDWVADAKLDDIPNTVAGAVGNIANVERPPFAITMHTTAGMESMRRAQQEADIIKMLGVTVLTSIPDDECLRIYGQLPGDMVTDLAHLAVEAGLKGIVSSPKEVGAIKSDPNTQDLFAMIPGTRPAWAGAQDQRRVTTPAEAIQAGADLLVIGRPITQADDPAEAYARIVEEIEGAL